MGLDPGRGPVRARGRADGRSVGRWRIALASDSLGISNGDALAPENTERLLLPRRAARASSSFVKEVKRRLVAAAAIPPLFGANPWHYIQIQRNFDFQKRIANRRKCDSRRMLHKDVKSDSHEAPGRLRAKIVRPCGISRKSCCLSRYYTGS